MKLKQKKIVQLRSRKNKQQPSEYERQQGVIFLGNLPFGFYEAQIRAFFSQFGQVLRLRVSRKLRSGKSKGYAFVQFKFDKVAQIAASAMDNYLMFEKIIKCKYVEPDKVYKDLFKGHDQVFHRSQNPELQAELANSFKDEYHNLQCQTRLYKTLQEKNAVLAKHGINYQFPLPETENVAMDRQRNRPEDAPVPTADESTLNEAYTLLVDSSDDEEITFKCPPNTVVKRKAKEEGENPPKKRRKKKQTEKRKKIKIPAEELVQAINLQPTPFIEGKKKQKKKVAEVVGKQEEMGVKLEEEGPSDLLEKKRGKKKKRGKGKKIKKEKEADEIASEVTEVVKRKKKKKKVDG